MAFLDVWSLQLLFQIQHGSREAILVPAGVSRAGVAAKRVVDDGKFVKEFVPPST